MLAPNTEKDKPQSPASEPLSDDRSCFNIIRRWCSGSTTTNNSNCSSSRGVKRRAVTAANGDTDNDSVSLNTLASISATQKRWDGKGLPPIGEFLNSPSHRLVFDKETKLPADDIVRELLVHSQNDFNIVSKLLQTKNLLDDYEQRNISTFMLLAMMANNVIYSKHPAITEMGVLAAIRAFVDEAKLQAPDALENPSISNCQSLLMLAVAYTHLGKFEVSSHYTNMSLRILHQLGVFKIDDNAWSEENEWISHSWIERERIRRVIWGSFTVDTFLALMQHSPPNLLVDISGVNRPCASNMWHVGNDGLESLKFPESMACTNPDDSEYVASVKKHKMKDIPWRINGTTVQINFAILGSAVLRGIYDPQMPQESLDKLVTHAFHALTDWLSSVPEMPENPSLEEIQHTMMISSVVVCLKSVITPYLITRSREKEDHRKLRQQNLAKAAAAAAAADRGEMMSSPLLSPQPQQQHMTGYIREQNGLSRNNSSDILFGDLSSDAAGHKMLIDYISNICRAFRHLYISRGMVDENPVPPMFMAYSIKIVGGVLAACAYSAPIPQQREKFRENTEYVKHICKNYMDKSLLFKVALDEIEQVERMVEFFPRTIHEIHLSKIRSVLVPVSVESMVNKRFAAFIKPIKEIIRTVPVPSSPGAETMARSPSVSSSISSAYSDPMASDNITGGGGGGGGGIPLTSNLCAIFGQKLASNNGNNARRAQTASTSSSDNSRRCPFGFGTKAYLKQKEVLNQKMSFTSVASLMVAITVASKDESFFDFLPEFKKPSSNLVNILN